ncbi:photosystem II 11 kDa protein [Ectocarpus siliculosus]|uniref:Photosystem II 11 kDa protein n=1 Tax=Ectocarpus siliculosus TaxID=2880 RepID=D8LJ72_ECTSI|nr:photosystem II 11 kDa protein [Ectocarpus siliculosus]|eukprot:CBN76956.1 photosystem II 11 kDa protein [Ectocarpus siliculosus]
MKTFAACTIALVAGDLAAAFTGPLAARTGATSAARASSSSAVCMSVGDEAMSRKNAIAAFSAGAAAVLGAAAVPAAVFAAEEAAAPAPAAVSEDGPPSDWGLTKQYYPDASKMVRHMRYCTNMEKGDPYMADIANNCKKEMVEFVSNYRRSSNINGKLSYSNLYTSISVLAGHYASYGPKFPVPEKRRKRLLQEYTDIERAIKRQR